MRSASVTYPVALTKALNWALVTVVAAIRNGSSSTLRIGPSPSSGYPDGSSVPIKKMPPGNETRRFIAGVSATDK